MRALLHSIFIAFYLLSSYATTQSRLHHISAELRHSHSRHVGIGDESKVKIPYTRFREAKKAGIAFEFRPQLEFRFVPQVTVRRFWLPEYSLRSQVDLEVAHSRAPPVVL